MFLIIYDVNVNGVLVNFISGIFNFFFVKSLIVFNIYGIFCLGFIWESFLIFWIVLIGLWIIGLIFDLIFILILIGFNGVIIFLYKIVVFVW